MCRDAKSCSMLKFFIQVKKYFGGLDNSPHVLLSFSNSFNISNLLFNVKSRTVVRVSNTFSDFQKDYEGEI